MSTEGVPDQSIALLNKARALFEEGSWSSVIELAGRVLADDPSHVAAFELLVSARRQLESEAAPEGERRVLTVLMCDLVSSTELIRKLGPETFRTLMLSVQYICVEAIVRYGGRVAQYLGDGVLAYFSYPQAHDDDAHRAVLAALRIVRGVEQLGTTYENVHVAVRIGIDTGTVVVGAMGSGQWTTTDSIVGDAPNMANRLQDYAGENGVLISSNTLRSAEGCVDVGPAERLRLKGFDEPIAAFRVLGAVETADRLDSTDRRTPFVGREPELAALCGAWMDVLDDQRRVVEVQGEAGIGKSRLAEQLTHLAKASGGRVIRARCSELYSHIAFHPVTDVVRQVLRLDALDGPLTERAVAHRLATLGTDPSAAADMAPVLARLFGLPDEQLASDRLPEQWREKTFAVLIRLVAAVADESPLLLVVEDVPSADDSTAELLRRLTALVPHGLCLLVTARAPRIDDGEEPSSLPLWGEYQPDLTVNLRRLGNAPTREIVLSLLPEGEDSVVGAIVGRSDGVPLFAEELARWVAGGGDQHALPELVETLLTARLDELDRDAFELASEAAVYGVDVGHELLMELTDLSSDARTRAVSTLLSRQILVLDSDRVDRAYRFSHVLFRDAAYRRLVKTVRQRRHHQCAAVLERRHSEGKGVAPGMIAYHYLQADQHRQALRWSFVAGQEASAVGAHVEAVRHYTQALDLLQLGTDEMEREPVELSLQLGLALSSSMVAGYSDDSAKLAFERAHALSSAMTLPATVETFGATMGLHAYMLVTGQLDRADELCARGLELARQAGDRGLEGAACAADGFAQFFRGRLDLARQRLSQTDYATSTLGVPQEPRIVSLALLGLIDWLEGDVDSCAEHIAQALSLAEELEGERAAFTRAYVLAYVACHAHIAGDSQSALNYASQAIAIAMEHGFQQWLAAAALHLGAALCASGELEQGRLQLLAVLDKWVAAGANLMTPYFRGQCALAELMAGNAAKAVDLLDNAIELAAKTGEHVFDAELHRFRATARARAQGAGSVEEDLMEAARLASVGGFRVYEIRALLDLARSDPNDVSEHGRQWSLGQLAKAVERWEGEAHPPEVAEALQLLDVG